MNTPPSPVVLILAAGRSTRFIASGGTLNKLQTPLCGLTVLDHVIRAAEQSGLPWHVVREADGDGMGDTIAAGVRATADAGGWLILPGDLPLISAVSLRAVAEGLRSALVVVPTWNQQKGHPVGFGVACFDELVQLSGDRGAARIVEAHRANDQVFTLALSDRGTVLDVDTLDDLQYVQTLMATDGL